MHLLTEPGKQNSQSLWTWLTFRDRQSKRAAACFRREDMHRYPVGPRKGQMTVKGLSLEEKSQQPGRDPFAHGQIPGVKAADPSRAPGVQADGKLYQRGRDRVIDLHLHTTASDGCCSPGELVSRARKTGIRTLAVTDHDTMAAVPEAANHAAACGMTFVPGIEITAVNDGRDVHVLGYFLSSDSPELTVLIEGQRRERLDRAREIVERLAKAGAPIDDERLFRAVTGRATIARPQIAQSLILAGHVCSVSEAFERFLSEGRPAYVPHKGPRPEYVVEVITKLGGIASLAHPGPLGCDHLIPALVDSGLAALEAYHSDHDLGTQRRYVELARDFHLAVTGGSDYHGNGRPRDSFFGVVNLPADEFARLAERVNHATI